MTNDCFIENWVKNNKSLLYFLFKLVCFWMASIILLMYIKYLYLGLPLADYGKSRISLNNMLTLGAVISATAFAWRQIEINQHTAKIELAIRYKDHYVKLVKALRNFINSHAELSGEISVDIQKSIWVELIDITLEGQLIFDTETQELNKKIQLYANEVMQSKRIIKSEMFSFLDKQKAEEQYWMVYCKLTEENNDNEKSIFDQATEIYKKNTVILTNNLD